MTKTRMQIRELARLATETGARLAKERADREAEATEKWRTEETKRLALQSAAPALLAACEALLPLVPATWAGCVRPGDWKGPGAERITNTLAECPCVNHEKLRAAAAAIAAARGGK